jgi:dTDP-4-amino-4,6-dideoxygalactose transaminase
LSVDSARQIPLALPAVGEAEWQALREPLDSGWLTQGPIVQRFERAFAERHGVGHALSTTSGTTALHLALIALGVGPGDEVIVPAFTWVATANAVLYTGATPVFADVDGDTYNVDPDSVAGAVTPKTRAVIPVHLFGLCADMGAVRAAVPADVCLVEDAACAVGAEYHGACAGGIGDAGCFSFHPRKIVTTGEGGMLTTNDPEQAAEVERLRNHGASVSAEVRHGRAAPYELPDFDVLGFNYRMSDVHAALGLVQLAQLEQFLLDRETQARAYQEALRDLPWLQLPSCPPGYRHSWQSYVVVVRDDGPVGRDQLMRRLQERGVSTRPGTTSVPTLGLYHERLGSEPDAFPVSKMLHERAVAIPLHNRMTSDDVSYVAQAIRASAER